MVTETSSSVRKASVRGKLGEMIYFSRFSGKKKKGRGMYPETETALQAAGEHRRLPPKTVIPGAGSSPPGCHRELADSSPLSQGARGGPPQRCLGAALSAAGRRPETRSLGAALCWRCPADLVNSVPSDFLVKRICQEALDSSL